MTRTISAAILLGTTIAGAAAAEPLSRAEAVARALDKNPVVRRSVAEWEGLRGRVQQARADALPEVNAFGTFTRYQDPGFLNSPNIDEFPPEILQAFQPVPTNLWDGSLSVHQTLYSFSLGKAIRAAGYARQLGSENVDRARQDVTLRAVMVYDAYLVALERVKVAETLVHQREEHLEMARNRRQAGVATELEVLRFEVDLANARTDLLRLQGATAVALGNLNAVMVAPTNSPIEPTDALTFRDENVDLPAVVQKAKANRPELKAIEWTERVYDEAIGIYQADSRPRLDFNGSYGWSTLDTSNFFKSNYEKWSLAVTLKIPIFDGWRTAGKVAQARADRRKVGQDRVELETAINLEAKQAVDRLAVARSVYRSAELNVTQARKALEMTEANYRLGAATTLDVIDAQAALSQAETTRVEALGAHVDARASLLYVMGQNPLEESAPSSATDNALLQQAPALAGGAPAVTTAGRD
jgi:outer membrane protein